MEARSLTTLNELAEFPPQYPETIAGKRQESLVLYISRVPGTRDVILSTLKPQERNVTGEDVANSFYYVHLELDSELALAESRRREEKGPQPLMIPRKPVPGQSRASSPDERASGSRSPLSRSNSTAVPNTRGTGLPNADDSIGPYSRLSHEYPGAALSSRQDQHDMAQFSNTRASQDRTATGLHPGVPARKPVGPRRMSATPETTDLRPAAATMVCSSDPLAQPLNHPAVRDNADGLGLHVPKIEQQYQQQHEQQPSLPRGPPVPLHVVVGSPHAQSSYANLSRPAHHATSAPPSPRKSNAASTNTNGTPFTLKIIRRDPSSRRQWNVGRVSSRQLDTVDNGLEEDGPTSPRLNPPTYSLQHVYPSINVELETPGYCQFRDYGYKDDFISLPRQLLMEYSQSFTKKLQKTYQRLEQTGLNKLNRSRSDSVGSITSNTSDAADDIDVIATDGPPPPGMKPRGYLFPSLWGGKCEFRTGQAGRSLICRHLPRDFGNSYNPLASDHASGARVVSDLRFNLPSAEILAEHGEQWKGNLEKFLRQVGGAQGSNDGGGGGGGGGGHKEDGSVSPFKLNLGAERAGGGSRGRRAKLGKLIVHDEGLKMLDLVVAANMGIWWGTWERNF